MVCTFPRGVARRVVRQGDRGCASGDLVGCLDNAAPLGHPEMASAALGTGQGLLDDVPTNMEDETKKTPQKGGTKRFARYSASRPRGLALRGNGRSYNTPSSLLGYIRLSFGWLEAKERAIPFFILKAV